MTVLVPVDCNKLVMLSVAGVVTVMHSVDEAETVMLSVGVVVTVMMSVDCTEAVMLSIAGVVTDILSVDVAETVMLSVAGVGHVRAMTLFLGMPLLDEEEGIVDTSDDELIMVSTSSDNALNSCLVHSLHIKP